MKSIEVLRAVFYMNADNGEIGTEQDWSMAAEEDNWNFEDAIDAGSLVRVVSKSSRWEVY